MTFMRRIVVTVVVLAGFLAGPPRSLNAQQAGRGTTAPVASQPARSVELQYESSYFRRPIIRVGQDYTLKADDDVRQINIVSGNLTVDGRVRDDVVVVLGDVKVESTAVINGSVVAIAGNVTIADGATIRQDLVVVGGVVDAPQGFSPRGEHIVVGVPFLADNVRSIVPWLTHGLLWGRLIVPNIRWVWAVVAIFFFISLVLNLVCDRPVRMCTEVILERPLAALVAGLLVLVLMGPAFIVMAATVIGLAVIPFVVCALLVAWRLGKVAVTRAIGASLVHQSEPESRNQGVRSFVIGFAAVCLAYMVPVLGLIVWAMIGVLGLGAATIVFARAIKRESPKKGAPESSAVAPPPTSPMGPGVEPAGASAYSSLGEETAPPVFTPPIAGPPPIAETRALHPQSPYATFLDRIAAFVLDCLLVAIADRMLRLTYNDNAFFLLLLAYHVAFLTWMGTTMGGIVVGIQAVRVHGGKLRFVDALVRSLSGLFSVAALGIGCFWMLQDPERQMWHDKIAGTHVVKVPRNVLLEGGARG